MNSMCASLCEKKEMKWKQREKEIFIYFFVVFCITWAYEHTTEKEKNIDADYISLSNVRHGSSVFIEYTTIFILTI